eukprot:scaffold213457_cov35-Tisochrysis_lutea.AAC.2
MQHGNLYLAKTHSRGETNPSRCFTDCPVRSWMRSRTSIGSGRWTLILEQTAAGDVIHGRAAASRSFVGEAGHQSKRHDGDSCVAPADHSVALGHDASWVRRGRLVAGVWCALKAAPAVREPMRWGARGAGTNREGSGILASGAYLCSASPSGIGTLVVDDAAEGPSRHEGKDCVGAGEGGDSSDHHGH